MKSHAQQVKKEMHRRGTSLVEWAAKNGYSIHTVRAIVYGHRQASRGVGHKIAVALGIKPDPATGRRVSR